MLSRHPWLSAHAAWLAAWLAVDLLWGGLIAAGGNTAGLQQAYMLLLYPLGVTVLLLLWAGARTYRALKSLPQRAGTRGRDRLRGTKR